MCAVRKAVSSQLFTKLNNLTFHSENHTKTHTHNIQLFFMSNEDGELRVNYKLVNSEETNNLTASEDCKGEPAGLTYSSLMKGEGQ